MNEIEIGVDCIICRSHFEFTVSQSGMIAWENGALIQDALPELDKNCRELLISRICGKCFDEAL